MELDRISNLPDSVLCHILSFLDTELAVRTCVLSKRWKSVYTFVPCLSFSGLNCRKNLVTPQRLAVFQRFVWMSLLQNRCESLDSFSIEYSERAVERSPFHGWIRNVISRNVSFLDLNLKSSNGMRGIINLPHRIFTANSLKTLILKGDVLVQIPPGGVVSLPGLKCLSLNGVKYGCGESFRKLIEGCPVLKSLYIKRSRFDNVTVFTVNSVTLERLEILAAGFGSWEENVDMKLEIEAPFLNYLRLCDYVSTDFSFGTLPMLHELHLFNLNYKLDSLDVRHFDQIDGCKCALDLLDAMHFDKLKILFIGTKEILNVFAESKQIFPNITFLTLTPFWNWRRLLQLLGKMENLKVLRLENECWDFDEEEAPPACFSSSLERISLLTWSTTPEGMEWDQANSLVGMIKYFLKHGEILRRFDISCSYLDLIDTYLRIYASNSYLRDTFLRKCSDLSADEEGNINPRSRRRRRRCSRDVLLGFTRKSSACEINVVYPSFV